VAGKEVEGRSGGAAIHTFNCAERRFTSMTCKQKCLQWGEALIPNYFQDDLGVWVGGRGLA
jgi:hypothetical protein